MTQQNPLYDLVDKLREYMTERQYSDRYIHQVCRISREIAEFGKQKGLSRIELGWLNEFLNLRFGMEYQTHSRGKRQEVLRAVDMLYSLQQHGRIERRIEYKRTEFPECYQCFFAAAEQYHNQRQHAKGTRRQINIQIRHFVEFLEMKVILPSELTNSIIREYLLLLTGYSKEWVSTCHNDLRNILHATYECGYIEKDFSDICANVHVPYDAKVPSVYTPKEIEAVLASVDRNNPSEKRDYAILLLAARLGLRSSDIGALAFSNVDWHASEIRLKQTKTGTDITLPMPEDVGWAIIDYVKNARPKSDSPVIFLRHLAPYEPIFSGSGFSNILDKYFSRAKIPIPKGKHHGIHTFRHSLASSLVANEVPMPVISEILGHTNTKSTSVYIKVDINGLRKCALEVTGGAVQ
jgi:site-specific recombinase XerD